MQLEFANCASCSAFFIKDGAAEFCNKCQDAYDGEDNLHG
jgi:hypothetical protein